MKLKEAIALGKINVLKSDTAVTFNGFRYKCFICESWEEQMISGHIFKGMSWRFKCSHCSVNYKAQKGDNGFAFKIWVRKQVNYNRLVFYEAAA